MAASLVERWLGLRRCGNVSLVRHWVLHEIETPQGTRSPVVLDSRDGAERAVLLELRAGEALGEHSVKESTLLLVLEGSIRIETGNESFDAGAEELFHFEPDERHSVRSDDGARILLLLSPWPGEGHYRGDPVARSSLSAS
jgi:quercetin dioxygenase-like cupin family protein